ncbi:MAG: 2-phospho-L-lactate transferase [Myxococcota bacterium]
MRHIVFLSGGIGGARLLHGLAQEIAPESLTAVVNTGDDLVHWGLRVSPDLDTVMYTLGEVADQARGWGLRDESFRALEMMKRYGEPSWFSLGDQDLATHLVRTARSAGGESLTSITQSLCAALGVGCRVIPMCDQPRCTWIDTVDHGPMPFQDWLVKHRAPAVAGVRFEGSAHATPEVHDALSRADLIIIGPSNPYVSIDPILTLEGVRDRVAQTKVVALSPIVRGKAVKGPLGEMIRALARREPSPQAIVDHYAGLLHGLVVERGDESAVREIPVLGTSTIMGGRDDRARLARELLDFADAVG